MALAFGRNVWPRLAWFGAYALSVSLVACVEDTSALTRGEETAGSAGEGSGGSAGAGLAGSGGETPLGGAGQSNEAGAPSENGGQSSAAGATSGGSAGTAGSAGSAPVCVAKGSETCNGIDDDCNGKVDEGCPATLTWTLQTDRPQLGDSQGGSVFGDQCDAGEVLTGVKVGVGGWVDQIRGVCSKFSIKPDTSKTPYVYRVELSGARELSPHPDTTASTISALTCPANQALVGMRVSQQHFNDGTNDSIVIPRLWISCTELTLKGQRGSYAIEWQTSAEYGPLSGSLANDTAWFDKDATPVPQVPVRLTGSSGDWIDRVGFATGKLTVTVR